MCTPPLVLDQALVLDRFADCYQASRLEAEAFARTEDHARDMAAMRSAQAQAGLIQDNMIPCLSFFQCLIHRHVQWL